ncbi:putative membrane protein [Chlamydiales bacterium STE3]|nr:putative membrane protein [Chlamydiales bacterium STE3]
MIKKILLLTYLLMLCTGLLLPSDGNHGFFAPKSLTFFATAFSFIFYLLSNRHYNRSQVQATLIVFFSIAFLLFWFIVGVEQDPQRPSGQMDQFKVFLITLFVPFVTFYIVKQKLITSQKIIKVVIYANFSYCLSKVLLMLLHVLGIINVWVIMQKTGLRYMSMEIFGSVGRIQTSVDIVTPFILYFVLQAKELGLHFSKKFTYAFFIVSLLSNFLSFSRFLLFVCLISLFFYWMTIQLKHMIKIAIFAVFLMAVGVVIATPEKVMQVVEKRLFSKDNYYSDLTRHDQITALMGAYYESPFLGQGLGGYTPQCIRDHLLPHAYEVQWVAFLMQFGMVGMILLLVPVGIISFRLIIPPVSILKVTFFLLFGLWLLSGFTNPFLISLTSGIVYALFLLVAESLSPPIPQLVYMRDFEKPYPIPSPSASL